jgi:predicted nucleic acid-binding protein
VNGLTIVDTDILIDAALQINQAVECLAEIERWSVLAVSVITQMELLVGCRNKAEWRNTERFLQRFQVLKLSDQVCGEVVDVMRQIISGNGVET